MGKRYRALNNVASWLDFIVGSFLCIDTASGNKKIPAEMFRSLENLKLITDDQYLYAITDSEGRFLAGIEKDGSVTWAKGLPEWLDSILNGLQNSINNLSSSKVDKEEGKSLIDSIFSGAIKIVSGDLYLFAITDSEGRVLFSIDRDGNVEFQKGNKVDKEEGKSLISEKFADGIKIISNEEYLYLITDSQGRVIFAIEKETGKLVGKFSDVNFRCFSNVAEMKKCRDKNIKFAMTSGFYEPGDGGAAKYILIPGEENGLSRIRVASGLVAKLVIEDNYLYPEQIGYTNTDASIDLRDYLFHITRDLKVNIVRLHPKRYYQNGPWIVPRQGISIIGTANSGDQQIDGQYYYTRILYSAPHRTDPGACVYNCEYREFRLENVEIRNLDASNPNNPPRIGIYTLEFHDDPEDPRYHHYDHYDMIIKNVKISDFYYGLNLTGNIKWNLQIDNVRCTSCNIGCRIYGHALVATFKLFYPDHCGIGILIDTLTVAVSFLYCNFGTMNRGIVFDKGYEDNPHGQYTFIGCNFELDEVPSEPKEALFLEVSELYRAMITLIGCNFNFSKIENSAYASQVFGMKFNEKTRISFIGCQQPDSRWEKQLLNPNYPAEMSLGSVKLISCDGIERPDYADEYYPTVEKNGTIYAKSVDDLNEYYSDAEPGKIVYDETNDKIYVKMLNNYKEL